MQPIRRTAPFVLAAGLLLPEAATAPASAQPPHDLTTSPRFARTLPDTVGAPADVKQLITVSARGWDATHARLKAWKRAGDGSWRLAHGPVRVVVGYNGWVRAADRVQSTGTTPAGRFRIPYAFGRKPNPGAHLRYRRVDGNDWWPYERRDPATYNVFQKHKARKTHWRPGKAEHLDSYTKQYGYALVVGFNLPHGISYSPRRKQWVARDRADIDRGGGIFLHVRGDGFTAGCVAMSRSDMRWLVRWVRPRADAQVVMGPRAYISRR